MPPLLSQFRALHRGKFSDIGEHPAPQSHHPSPSPQLVARSSLDNVPLSRCYAQVARDLMQSLLSSCSQLGPEDVALMGGHPTAAGEFADIWGAIHDGRNVVLKSYRCSTLSSVAQVVDRFRNEVHVWTLLNHRGVDVVPLVGVYSTEAHYFGLVYEYMSGLDLRRYLRNEPKVGKLKLLAGIARSLDRLRDLGISHGNIQTVNILVDKDGTPRIGGLSNASVLPRPTVSTVEGKTNTNRLSRGHAPELTWPGTPQNPIDPVHPVEASDMYAFGVMAWEVLTGRQPFSEMTEVAATYSMLNGTRPPRPENHEISDTVWYMIECCWHHVPSKRMSAGEVVKLLENEAGCMPDSRTVPRA